MDPPSIQTKTGLSYVSVLKFSLGFLSPRFCVWIKYPIFVEPYLLKEYMQIPRRCV